jgi:hypothetical protein
MSSSEDDSGVNVPTFNSVTLLNERQHTKRIFTNKGPRKFFIVDHTTNLRRNTKISPI